MKIIFSTLVSILLWAQNASTLLTNENRSFIIDYENDQFLKDGQTFRVISGAFDYYRSLPATWSRKLNLMRSAGLNSVKIYVEWSLHNPEDECYKWDGLADLERFIQLAVDEDLFVILLPGPYTNFAERDNAGLPYWLLSKYPNIRIGTQNDDYVHEVRKWFTIIMTKMNRFLYGNGGPIIMVQAQHVLLNGTCTEHNQWIQSELRHHVNEKAILFTMYCESVDGIFAAPHYNDDLMAIPESRRNTGPIFHPEFYTGWHTIWKGHLGRVDTEDIVLVLKPLLKGGASVNFYEFCGGTNFGFSAGSYDSDGLYRPLITSYDYDAPINEAGNPTPKFFAMREVILEYTNSGSNVSIPPATRPIIKLLHIHMTPIGTILSQQAREHFGTKPIHSLRPLSFEELHQNSGFVLYETSVPDSREDPGLLVVDDLRDRAQVFLDGHFLGILSRQNKIFAIPISVTGGSKLQIFVENQGRSDAFFPIYNNMKGILGSVKFAEEVLHNWTMTGFPFDSYGLIEKFIKSAADNQSQYPDNADKSNLLRNGPTIFHSTFNISPELTSSTMCDTFLDPTGWGKGFVFINGFNVGRYWPSVGPQVTLYVPGDLLKIGENQITIVEMQRAPESGRITFSDKHLFNEN